EETLGNGGDLGEGGNAGKGNLAGSGGEGLGGEAGGEQAGEGGSGGATIACTVIATGLSREAFWGDRGWSSTGGARMPEGIWYRYAQHRSVTS
ncbi:MAG: hypothetical protein RMJ98_23175, partial [Myxococcales bacterium]|nr:hypothetical protein [Myxococcales bacterium]